MLHAKVSLFVLAFSGIPNIIILFHLDYCSRSSHCDLDDFSSSGSCLTFLDSSFMVSLRSFATALTDCFTTISVGVFLSTSNSWVTILSWILGIWKRSSMQPFNEFSFLIRQASRDSIRTSGSTSAEVSYSSSLSLLWRLGEASRKHVYIILTPLNRTFI